VAYSVFLRFFYVHDVTYIYYAILSWVKCVACAKLLMSIVLLLLELSVGVGWGRLFFVHLYFCMFVLPCMGRVSFLVL